VIGLYSNRVDGVHDMSRLCSGWQPCDGGDDAGGRYLLFVSSAAERGSEKARHFLAFEGRVLLATGSYPSTVSRLREDLEQRLLLAEGERPMFRGHLLSLRGRSIAILGDSLGLTHEVAASLVARGAEWLSADSWIWDFASTTCLSNGLAVLVPRSAAGSRAAGSPLCGPDREGWGIACPSIDAARPARPVAPGAVFHVAGSRRPRTKRLTPGESAVRLVERCANYDVHRSGFLGRIAALAGLPTYRLGARNAHVVAGAILEACSPE
jgi:hypothetical protein